MISNLADLLQEDWVAKAESEMAPFSNHQFRDHLTIAELRVKRQIPQKEEIFRRNRGVVGVLCSCTLYNS